MGPEHNIRFHTIYIERTTIVYIVVNGDKWIEENEIGVSNELLS